MGDIELSSTVISVGSPWVAMMHTRLEFEIVARKSSQLLSRVFD